MVCLSASTSTLLLATVSLASALAPPQPPATTDRRQLLGSLVGGAVAAAMLGAPEPASATKALTGLGSPFTGDYDDPNHPGCLRQVKVVGAPLRGDGTRSAYPVVEVKGYDGKGDGKTCTDRPTRADIWSVEGKLKTKDEATFDFSPKGGPERLQGKWDGEGIVFPDGNRWTKVPLGTPERRPVDMSTLKSPA